MEAYWRESPSFSRVEVMQIPMVGRLAVGSSIKVLLLGLIALAVIVEGVSAPIEWLWPYRFGGNTHWQGTTRDNYVSLTFDDGPSRFTEHILNVLTEHGVSATFFVMGRQVERFSETVKRMASEGHEVGNHTFSFEARRYLHKLYFSGNGDDVSRTQEIIEAVTGKAPRYFRSPGGQMGRGLWRAIREYDLEVVYGTLPFPRPEESAESQLRTVLDNLKPGGIVILHDGDDHHPDSDRPRATVELLPQLLNELNNRGYRVVSLDEIFQEK